jgi:hypothetical protein
MVKMGVKLAWAGLAAALLLGSAEPARAAQTLQMANDLCGTATKQAEQEAKLPRHLLTAISLAESGRWDQRVRASFAWPWTVTAGGSSMYYPSKEEAVAAVKALKKQGRTNIDVGCMQINLHYHPNAFETLEDGFDPATNAGYAARFLAGLHKETESWAEAAGKYHSSDPARNGPYRDKVFALYEKVSGRRHTDLGRIEVANADATETETKRAQEEALTMRFRARLAAERNAPKNSRAMAQLDKLRQEKLGTAANARNHEAALRKAERERAQRDDLVADKQTFEQKRRAQLAAWRQTRSSGVFRQ